MPIASLSDILATLMDYLGPILPITLSLWCGCLIIGLILRFVKSLRRLDDLPVSHHPWTQRTSIYVFDLYVPYRDRSGARLCPWCAGYPGHQHTCKNCGAPNVRRYPYLRDRSNAGGAPCAG